MHDNVNVVKLALLRVYLPHETSYHVELKTKHTKTLRKIPDYSKNYEPLLEYVALIHSNRL